MAEDWQDVTEGIAGIDHHKYPANMVAMRYILDCHHSSYYFALYPCFIAISSVKT
jgi:hypothetical protein